MSTALPTLMLINTLLLLSIIYLGLQIMIRIAASVHLCLINPASAATLCGHLKFISSIRRADWSENGHALVGGSSY